MSDIGDKIRILYDQWIDIELIKKGTTFTVIETYGYKSNFSPKRIKFEDGYTTAAPVIFNEGKEFEKLN